MDKERIKKLAGILKEEEQKEVKKTSEEEFVVYEFDSDIDTNDESADLYTPLKDEEES